MLIDAAAVVEFHGGLGCGSVAQGRIVVMAAIGVVNAGVAEALMLRGVVGDAAVGALFGLHGVWPRRDGVLSDWNRDRFVGRSVASPRGWLLPAGEGLASQA